MTDAAADAPTDERVRRRRSQRPRRSTLPLRRAGFVAGAAIALAGLALALAIQPYDPWLPLVVCAGLAAAASRWPGAGIAIALTLLPVADLTAWTGMFFATESDLVVLSVVAGIAARYAVATPSVSAELPPSGTYLVLAGLLLASYASSTIPGLIPFPPLDVRALAGFGSPYNGVRVAKGALLGALLLACFRGTVAAQPAIAWRSLQVGLVGGTTAVALAALWERVAFVGLTEFAADYRTTATFWEMHVGGAQLDGWLALTLPFALWALLRSRSPVAALGLAAANALILYATLTTFSRGLFVAVGVEVLLLVLLAFRRTPGDASGRADGHPLLAVVLFVLLLGHPAFAVFAAGGYRGLLALLASGGLAFVAAPLLSRLTIAQGVLAVGVGALTGFAAGLLFVDLPKAIYVIFALAFGAGGVLVGVLARRSASRGWLMLAGVATAIPPMIAPQVAAYWSGQSASGEVWLAGVIALSPLVLCRLRRPVFWESTLPANAVAAIALVGLGAVAAIGQSYYAGSRFSTVSQDMADRTVHWRRGLSLVSSPKDWLIGIGTGRYAEAYYWNAQDQFLPGTFTLKTGEGGNTLALGSASAPVGWGAIFRITQRIDPRADGPLRLDLRARVTDADGAAPVFHAQVCRQWLLYNEECVFGQIALQPGERDYTLALPGSLGDPSVWGIARPAQFAMGLDSVGRSAEVVSVQLADAAGRPLLENGQFVRGMAWWFFSSERIHLPYHAKNLWLHALIEQGMLGLLAVTLFGGLAVLWVAAGPGRSHPLAPACLAGLLGFGIVGAFDSLVDAPRLALMFVLLGGLALSLRGSPPVAAG